MRDELGGGVVASRARGGLRRDMVAGASVAAPVAALVGALVALPFGFMAIGELALWGRLVVAIGIGAFCGSLVGVVVGAAVGARSPAQEHNARKRAVGYQRMNENRRRK